MGMIRTRSLVDSVPTSAATAAYPSTPGWRCPIDSADRRRLRRGSAGMAEAAAVLVDGPAASEVGNSNVRPSALMN